MNKNIDPYRNLILEYRLLEKKDHLIDKLDISEDQKQTLKNFFAKHPNYENKIDWNRKNLTFDDFKSLLSMEGRSKTQLKKKGIEGLVENVDYIVLETGIFNRQPWVAYQPLTYEGSKTIASNKVPPARDDVNSAGNVYSGAQWCTAYQKNESYFEEHFVENEEAFIYLCGESIPTKKIAIEINPLPVANEWLDSFSFRIWDYEDHRDTVELSELPPEIPSLIDSFLQGTRNLVQPIIDELKNHRIPREFVKEGILTIPRAYKAYIKGAVILPDNTEQIGDGAFVKCENLEKVIIPNSVREIGRDAFIECYSLKELVLGDSVEFIDYYAFDGCDSLERVYVSSFDSWYNIFFKSDGSNPIACCYAKLFVNNKPLKGKLALPKKGNSVSRFVLSGCTEITELVVPEGIVSIDTGAFSDCTGLKKVTLPESVKRLSRDVFRGCENLESVYIPDLFSWCNIKFAETTSNPLYYAQNFYVDGILQEERITVPQGIKILHSYVFGAFANLSEIILPDSLLRIETDALPSRGDLKIYFKGTEEQWHEIEGSENLNCFIFVNTSEE